MLFSSALYTEMTSYIDCYDYSSGSYIILKNDWLSSYYLYLWMFAIQDLMQTLRGCLGTQLQVGGVDYIFRVPIIAVVYFFLSD